MVASDPAFMGIEYQISLHKITRAQAEDGDEQEILATLSFDHGDDLYDCEDYNEVGGLPVDQVGNFAILNPSGVYSNFQSHNTSYNWNPWIFCGTQKHPLHTGKFDATHDQLQSLRQRWLNGVRVT